MCTRYISPDTAAIQRHWHVGRDNAWRGGELFPRSPGAFIRATRDSAEPERELLVGQWGLIPWFATEAKVGFSTVNARFEEITSKPSYKDPWRYGKRCIIPAWSFDEPTGRQGATCGGAFVELMARRGASPACGTRGPTRPLAS